MDTILPDKNNPETLVDKTVVVVFKDFPVNLAELVDKLQRQMIARALKQADGNTSQAARMLEMNRPNLIYKMKVLEITK